MRLVLLFVFNFIAFYSSAQDVSFFDAIEKNDLTQVQKTLKDEAKANQIHPKTRWSPLHYAVKGGNLEMVKALLRKNANPNLQTPITDSSKGIGRFTPLHLAVQANQKEMVKELLKADAKPEIKGQSGFTALHLAAKNANPEIIQLLLDKGALINTKTTLNLNALHLAIEQGNVALMDFLLKKGIDKEAATKFYSPKQLYTWSPLLISVWLGKEEAVQKLLENNVNIQYKTLENQNALHLAIEKGNANLVKILVEKGVNRDLADKNGKTPRKLAHDKGNEEIIELIEEGTFYGNIQNIDLNLGGKSVSDNFQDNPATLSPTPDNGAVITWQDANGDCHILRLNAQNQALGAIITIPKIRIFSAVAHSDGFAILLAKEVNYDAEWKSRTYRAYFLAKYDYSGHKTFETKILGDDKLDAEGKRVADANGRNINALAWSGKNYAVYLAHYKHWGDKGEHQGDMLAFYKANGEPDEAASHRGWDWGVSHSFSQKLIFNTDKFICLATGDSYPRGISAHIEGVGQKVIMPIESSPFRYQDIFGTRISTPVKGDKGTFWVAYMSAIGNRATHDIGLINFDSTGKMLKQTWLTNTADLDESNPRLATLGKDKYLLMWEVTKRKDVKQTLILENVAKHYQEFLIIERKGALVTPKPMHAEEKYYSFYPDKFNTTVNRLQYVDLDYGQRKSLASDKTDFINFSNGDIGYLRLNPDKNQIQLFRIKP
jgi:ankyrin repeat protein